MHVKLEFCDFKILFTVNPRDIKHSIIMKFQHIENRNFDIPKVCLHKQLCNAYTSSITNIYVIIYECQVVFNTTWYL